MNVVEEPQSVRRETAAKLPKGGARDFVAALLLAATALASAPARGWCQAGPPEPTTRPVGAGTAPNAAPAAPPHDPQAPRVYRMTVRARATSRPALQYQLVPELADQTSGNAADLFMLVFLRLAQSPADAYKLPQGQTTPSGADDKVSLYLELPPEQFLARRREVEEFLAPLESQFRDADIAARRERCQWDSGVREEGFDALLPHLNYARQLANLLAVRARFQVLTGDWAGATRTLQTGFSLGHGVGGGVLVDGLVGAAIGAVFMEHGVRDWQQRPEGPNLYWDLAGLPRPFVDFRGAMQWERAALTFSFPQLKKLRGPADGSAARFTEQDWQDFQDRVNRYVGQSSGPVVGPGDTGPLPALGAAIVLYPRAKKRLVEWGWDEQKVREMPVGQVLAEYEFGDYERTFDEMFKWADLPFPQAYEGMNRTTAEFLKAQGAGMANPLLRFIPAVAPPYLSMTRLDREIAAAQTIEALRDYAARHDGRAPEKLDDLTETPAPLDPITGKPFEYRLEPQDQGGAGGGVAGPVHVTLNCPAPAGARPRDAARYEVTIVKP